MTVLPVAHPGLRSLLGPRALASFPPARSTVPFRFSGPPTSRRGGKEWEMGSEQDKYTAMRSEVAPSNSASLISKRSPTYAAADSHLTWALWAEGHVGLQQPAVT